MEGTGFTEQKSDMACSALLGGREAMTGEEGVRRG
jgi:hypothetical protein